MSETSDTRVTIPLQVFLLTALRMCVCAAGLYLAVNTVTGIFEAYFSDAPGRYGYRGFYDAVYLVVAYKVLQHLWHGGLVSAAVVAVFTVFVGGGALSLGMLLDETFSIWFELLTFAFITVVGFLPLVLVLLLRRQEESVGPVRASTGEYGRAVVRLCMGLVAFWAILCLQGGVRAAWGGFEGWALVDGVRVVALVALPALAWPTWYDHLPSAVLLACAGLLGYGNYAYELVTMEEPVVYLYTSLGQDAVGYFPYLVPAATLWWMRRGGRDAGAVAPAHGQEEEQPC